MLLSVLVDEYVEHLPAGIVLDKPQIARSMRKAVRFYCGYATLKSSLSQAQIDTQAAIDAGECPPYIIESDPHSRVDASDEIEGDQDFEVTPSEYAIIRPLFELYVEHENAMSLEASRALGIDVYGRTTAEITIDINMKEAEMPKTAFMEPVVTI